MNSQNFEVNKALEALASDHEKNMFLLLLVLANDTIDGALAKIENKTAWLYIMLISATTETLEETEDRIALEQYTLLDDAIEIKSYFESELEKFIELQSDLKDDYTLESFKAEDLKNAMHYGNTENGPLVIVYP